MSNETELRNEYRAFLAARGLVRKTHRGIAVDQTLEFIRQDAIEQGLQIDTDAELEFRSQFTSGTGLGELIVASLVDELDKAIEITPFKLRLPTYVAEFSTGSFNAQARRVPSGVLILINEGLMDFLHQALKIMSYSMDFRDTKEGQISVPRVLPEPDHIAVVAMTEVVLAYLFLQNSAAAAPLPRPVGYARQFLTLIVRECQKAVIAHEYGHVYWGHLNDMPTRPTSSLEDTVRFVRKSSDQEIQADIVASLILLQRIGRGSLPTPRSVQEAWSVCVSAAAPLLVFGIDMLTSAVAECLEGDARRMVWLPDDPLPAHPEGALRAHLTIRTLQGIGLPPSAFEVFGPWLNFFAAITPKVAALSRSATRSVEDFKRFGAEVDSIRESLGGGGQTWKWYDLDTFSNLRNHAG